MERNPRKGKKVSQYQGARNLKPNIFSSNGKKKGSYIKQIEKDAHRFKKTKSKIWVFFP